MAQGKTQQEIDAQEAYLRSLKRYRTVGVSEGVAALHEMEIQRILKRWRDELIPGPPGGDDLDDYAAWVVAV